MGPVSVREVKCKSALSNPEDWILRCIRTFCCCSVTTHLGTCHDAILTCCFLVFPLPSYIDTLHGVGQKFGLGCLFTVVLRQAVKCCLTGYTAVCYLLHFCVLFVTLLCFICYTAVYYLLRCHMLLIMLPVCYLLRCLCVTVGQSV